jgi:hypothetical protein
MMHSTQAPEAKVLRPVSIALGLVAAVSIVAAASARPGELANIEPSERVHGMLVVQGSATRANTALFGIYCRPDIVKSGRYRRSCGSVPRVRRLFVGYGVFALNPKMLSGAWSPSSWSMWIDGERVSLDEFGTSDRWLYQYKPAGGRDAVLREWSVTLAQPTPGQHTIRYRFRVSSLSIDATWVFTVTTT